MTGIPSWAKPRTPIECIDGAAPNCLGAERCGGYPVTGGKYTIQCAYLVTRYGRPFPVISIAEFPSAVGLNGWDLSRFKPLISKHSEAQEQADIEMFKRLLKPSSIPSERLDAFLAELGVL